MAEVEGEVFKLPAITETQLVYSRQSTESDVSLDQVEDERPHGYLPSLGLRVYRSRATPDDLRFDREQHRLQKLARRQSAMLYMQRGWDLWNDKLRNLRSYYMRLLNPEYEDDDIGVFFDNRGMIGATGQVGMRPGLTGGYLRGHEGTDAIYTGNVGRDSPDSIRFS